MMKENDPIIALFENYKQELHNLKEDIFQLKEDIRRLYLFIAVVTIFTMMTLAINFLVKMEQVIFTIIILIFLFPEKRKSKSIDVENLYEKTQIR